MREKGGHILRNQQEGRDKHFKCLFNIEGMEVEEAIRISREELEMRGIHFWWSQSPLSHPVHSRNLDMVLGRKSHQNTFASYGKKKKRAW